MAEIILVARVLASPPRRGLLARNVRFDPVLARMVTPSIECGQDATAEHLHAAQGAA